MATIRLGLILLNAIVKKTYGIKNKACIACLQVTMKLQMKTLIQPVDKLPCEKNIQSNNQS